MSATPHQTAVSPRSEILRVDNLQTEFHTSAGVVRAVRDVSFSVFPGETLGIVGESGCGKSVTMASILRLLPDTGRVVGGSVFFNGADISKLQRRADGGDPRQPGRHDLSGSDDVSQPCVLGWRAAHRASGQAQGHQEGRSRQGVDMLAMVGIDNPAERLKSFPHQFSGGMRQRVMVAIALITDPLLLIADEPTTALDVTIQAQILELMKRLKAELNTAAILITHDLGVVADTCDRVLVMYGGKIVEQGRVGDIFYRPQHPYTQGLLGSVPNPTAPVRERLVPIPGQPPDLLSPPKGCPFVPRCRYAMAVCSDHMPDSYPVADGHKSACWLQHPRAPRADRAAAGVTR
jgi:oligopeptide transport system ATP-binding protein